MQRNSTLCGTNDRSFGFLATLPGRRRRRLHFTLHCLFFSLSLSPSRTLTNVWIYNCFILWPGPVTSTHAAHATLEMHWVRMALAAQCAKWALQGRFIYTEIHAHTVRTHTHIKIFHLSTIAICWLLMPKTLVFIFISRANVCRVNSNRFMKAIR